VQKKSRRGKSPAFEGKTMDVLVEASHYSELKFIELKRHNGVLESLQEKKILLDELKSVSQICI
jgi:hypothetical protein